MNKKPQNRAHAKKRQAAKQFYDAWLKAGLPDYFESHGFRVSLVEKAPPSTDSWDEERKI